MSAVAERPLTITEVPRRPVTEQDACALAQSYLRWASACWRGERIAPVFATQLAAYWYHELPTMPAGQADAISPHGGGGRGIHWYHTDQEVLGYVPGAAGGYQVPAAAIPQLVRCTYPRPRMTHGRLSLCIRDAAARKAGILGTMRAASSRKIEEEGRSRCN
jgi:hypothetical protein